MALYNRLIITFIINTSDILLPLPIHHSHHSLIITRTRDASFVLQLQKSARK